jgi:predicted proteasome-type protease
MFGSTPAPDQVLVLRSAGNLATTQEVLDRIQVDIDTTGDHDLDQLDRRIEQDRHSA